MAIANNADIYAASRQNIWFTANNQTSADGNLTGQCVTLDKWFMAEMTSVPAPFSARGNANTMGRTLVAQGHAYEVPFSDRRRGDIICYEYGTYGHTAIQLSGGRVFESNVNWSGVATKLDSTGERVYASRIGSENEAWRVGKNPHVYRLKTYSEPQEDTEVKIGSGDNWYWRFNRLHHQLVRNADLPREVFNAIVGMDAWKVIESWSDHPESDLLIHWQEVGQLAEKDNWPGQIYGLQDERNIANAKLLEAQQQLANAIKPEELAKANQAVADAQAAAKKAQDELSAALAQQKADQEVGNAFTRWIGSVLSKLLPGGK